MALGSGSNPAAYFTGQLFPGQRPFYNALHYYMGQEFGPQGNAAGNLARSEGMNEGAAGYYGDRPNFDPGSGAAQASAQGAFGNLLSAQAAANNAAALANAQTQAQNGQGILNVASAYGNDISQNLQAEQALKNAEAAQSSGMMSNMLGLFTGQLGTSIGHMADPSIQPQGGLQAFQNLTSGGGSGSGGSGTPSNGQFAMPGTDYTPSVDQMQGQLPSFIDPNQIIGVSTQSGVSPESINPGLLSSMLSGVGAWF